MMAWSEDTASVAHWRAAGVRHAVLLRVLPALRHDLATPISVMRMTASVVQRKLAAQPVDAAYCSQRIAALDPQFDAVNQALRWLLDWGVGAAEGQVTRSQLVAGCIGLVQPLWALEGVLIEVAPALRQQSRAAGEGPAGEPCWPRQSALRYLLLAALCHAHDSTIGLTRIRIAPDRHDALQLQHFTNVEAAEQRDDLPCHSARSHQEPFCIDAAALACLAADLGYLVRFNHDGLWLQLAERKNGAIQQKPDLPAGQGCAPDPARAVSR